MNHYWEVTKHKAWVFWYCIKFCSRLILRCFMHDFSKYGDVEAAGFIDVTESLIGLTYGSKEYNDNLKLLAPTLKHHYAANSHHPEHYPLGFYNMKALDRLEMIFDWMASVKRNKGGDIIKSLDINQDRFKYTNEDKDWLRKITEDVNERCY